MSEVTVNVVPGLDISVPVDVCAVADSVEFALEHLRDVRWEIIERTVRILEDSFAKHFKDCQ